MKKIIYSDLYRYTGNTSYFSFIKNLILNPAFRYTYVFRKTQYYSAKRFSIFKYYYKVKLRMLMVKYGYQIPSNVEIGKGFYIGHFGSVVINPKVTIGNNVNIAKGVVLGQSNRGKNIGVPTICDKVWIGSNAVIVGNIVINSDVLIAPNAYVNFDVPSHSIVIGNPAKVIPVENATKAYINNCI
ncbi:serine O-acetyltransferase [Peribacillus sp. FSL R5-0717]|uniref:serine O-acetyltransferase n=1 Tax=Peribacillus sp. FSL R5-0717 TaxID=2975308 RepID=UPI0030F72334